MTFIRAFGALVPALLAAAALSGCATTKPVDAPRAGPIGIEDRRAQLAAQWTTVAADEHAPDDGESALRHSAIAEAALAAGAQAGHAARVDEINASLGERRAGRATGIRSVREADLDRIFDFRRVAIALPSGRGWILPPVILRSEGAWTGSADGSEAASADRWYAIARPGRIVPDVPDWREWLWLDAGEMPAEPPAGLRPTTESERAVALDALERGWQAGIAQADTAFEVGLARLERDYGGMLEYRVLVHERVIDELVLSDESLGVLASDDGNELRIGTRKLRIVSPATFGGAWHEWAPAIVPSE